VKKIEITRETGETSIRLQFLPKSGGAIEIATGLPFLDHMLAALSLHGGLSLNVEASGDVEVDPHHLIEDVGITLGKAVRRFQEENKNIERSGFFIFPMDGSLAQVAMDLSGRTSFQWNVPFNGDHSTPYPLAVFREFFMGFTQGARAALHVNVTALDNDHHGIEACFKAFGKALSRALELREESGPTSTKGMIDD
jgi:imidazoleglycerol-phosphate dehydratase